MKKFLILACLALSLAAFAAPASAESYILAIHGLNSTGPEGFEMKGYAQTSGDSLDGLSISLDLFPTIDTDEFFINNTDFKLKITVAVKDSNYNNLERFFLDFSSLVNYVAYGNGVFGLLDADDVSFQNDIIIEGQTWTVTTVLSKSLEGGAHYTMTSSLSAAASTPAPAAALLLIPGVVGLGLLRRRIR